MSAITPSPSALRPTLLLPAMLLTGTLLTPLAIQQVSPTQQLPANRAGSASIRLKPHFEANRGQTDARVRFLSRGAGHTLFLTDEEAVFRLRPGRGASAPEAVLRMRPVGGRAANRSVAAELQRGRVSYLRGKNPARWQQNVPTFARITYPAVYPGVDLVYYTHPERGELEYDFVVQPGAAPEQARLSVTGATGARVSSSGDLVLDTPAGEVMQRRPDVYQEQNGKRQQVPGEFQLVSNNGVARDAEVAFGFRIGEYDRSHPLVIDPGFVFSTYLGGGSDDSASSVAVDTAGNAYITGFTISNDFPLEGAAQGTPGGGVEAFVTKLDPLGQTLIYSTYLGGEGDDVGTDIAVDDLGAAYVTGRTRAPDFPTINPVQEDLSGDADAFVAKLTPQGNALAYATYLGGSGNENSNEITFITNGGIAVDANRSAYITGSTNSIDFPVTQNPLQLAFGGGVADAFVTKLSPNGGALAYSTYLGGSGSENIFGGGDGIAVDAAGLVTVTGQTQSDNFLSVKPFQAARAGVADAFLTRLRADGRVALFSTYFGGGSGEAGEGVALDGVGGIYLTGETNSSDGENFPLLGAFQPNFGGGGDAFVSKFTFGTALTLVYSSYLGGGNADEFGYDIAVNPTTLEVAVAGATNSTNFPRVSPLQTTFGGGRGDAFVTKVNANGASLKYSTYLGGNGDDSVFRGAGVAMDGGGRVYVAGVTASTNFPTARALQAARRGTSDAFLAKISDVLSAPASPDRLDANALSSARVELTWRDNSANEVAFEVQRGANSGAFVNIGETAANITTFTDADVSTGQRWIYRVRARNGDGVSGFSNEDSVTVPKAGKLRITPRRLSFKTVRVGKRKTLKVTLKNTGKGPALAVPQLPQGMFLLGRAGRIIVLPKKSVKLPVIFAPTARGAAAGVITFQVDGGAAQTVRLSGTGK